MPTKLSNYKQRKGTEKWLLVVRARLPTPVVGGEASCCYCTIEETVSQPGRSQLIPANF